MGKIFFLMSMILPSFLVSAQQVILLYPNGVPNSKPATIQEKADTDANGTVRISNVTVPTLTAFLPAANKATGTAVIICPGGGYHILAIKHEGYDEAKVFQQWGIAAFVLKYRLPDDKIMIDKEIGPLQDAQRAIQIVRQRAAAWNINPHQIGVMGFSAGGHLASTAGTHFNHAVIDNKNNISLRPDFMILCYPVISFTDSIGHIGSRDNLLGKNPSPEKIKEYSNEMQVTDKTPPTFIMQATTDNVVKVENSVAFYTALHQHHVPVEMHLYEKGPHGFGMNNPTTKDQWMQRLYNWMDANGWLEKK